MERPKKRRWTMRAADRELNEICPPIPVVMSNRPNWTVVATADEDRVFFHPWTVQFRDEDRSSSAEWYGKYLAHKIGFQLTFEYGEAGEPPIETWMCSEAVLTRLDPEELVLEVGFDSCVLSCDVPDLPPDGRRAVDSNLREADERDSEVL